MDVNYTYAHHVRASVAFFSSSRTSNLLDVGTGCCRDDIGVADPHHTKRYRGHTSPNVPMIHLLKNVS